jgi:hypothetical protein
VQYALDRLWCHFYCVMLSAVQSHVMRIVFMHREGSVLSPNRLSANLFSLYLRESSPVLTS